MSQPGAEREVATRQGSVDPKAESSERSGSSRQRLRAVSLETLTGYEFDGSSLASKVYLAQTSGMTVPEEGGKVVR